MAVRLMSFNCVLKNKLGRVISSTYNQNILSHDNKKPAVLGGLIDALKCFEKGEKRAVALRAEQAYGFYDPNLVIKRPIEELMMSEPVIKGERITYIRNGKKGIFKVVEVARDSITLDGNHPLAGQDLIFEIEMRETRDATPEEIAMASIDPREQSVH